MPIVLKLKIYTKSFKVYSDKGRTLKERLLFKNRRAFETARCSKVLVLPLKKVRQLG